MSPLDEARAALARRYPNIAPDDDAICADCFTSVHVRDGCEWTNGEDVCDACASRRLGRTEAGLRAILAEVDRLTAERDEARADAAELRGGAVGSVHKLRARLAEVEAERDAAVARADRLARVLACERGEWAPEGWVYSFSQGQWMHIADPFRKVWRNGWMRRPDGSGYVAWGWEAWIGGEQIEGVAPTALEAIEATDAARKGAK